MQVMNKYVSRWVFSESLEMLSQSAGYAATALGCVAAMGGNPASVKEIAQACGIPHPYLAKIINILSHKQLVQTQRGVGGGVVLARPPQEISLFELCEALDDPVVQPRCMLGSAACTEDRTCPAHRFCRSHRRELAEFLQTTTLADMAAFETRRRWKASELAPDTAPVK
jgi:Rrf2 family protein